MTVDWQADVVTRQRVESINAENVGRITFSGMYMLWLEVEDSVMVREIVRSLADAMHHPLKARSLCDCLSIKEHDDHGLREHKFYFNVVRSIDTFGPQFVRCLEELEEYASKRFASQVQSAIRLPANILINGQEVSQSNVHEVLSSLRTAGREAFAYTRSTGGLAVLLEVVTNSGFLAKFGMVFPRPEVAERHLLPMTVFEKYVPNVWKYYDSRL